MANARAVGGAARRLYQESWKALFEEAKRPLPFLQPERIDVKRIGGKIVKTEILTDREFRERWRMDHRLYGRWQAGRAGQRRDYLAGSSCS